ncbi:ABC transporter ATP-binding protein [Methanomethylophilus alvi]|uniref:ABC transporter ATP-binding protein n=1 Tax=Methanomethylophilus alvi TaxID=1291540 RepID=UPI0037DC8444
MSDGKSGSAFGTTWKRIIVYLGKDRRILWASLILSFMSTILTLIGPGKLTEITDKISEGLGGAMDIDGIAGLVIVLVAIYTAGLVLSVIENYMVATLSQRTAGRLREDLSSKINRIPLSYFDSTSTGDTLSRVTNDADRVGESTDEGLGTFISEITLLIGALVMMVYTNITMAMAAILPTVAGMLMMLLIMRKSQKYFQNQQRNLGDMNGLVEETYSGHTVIKTYNAEGRFGKRFVTVNEDLCRSAFASQFLSGMMMPLMSFIGNFGYVMVCIVGALLALDGQISIGVIVAFMIYVRLFTQPLSGMAQAFTSMQTAAAAGERVFEFLDLPEMVKDETEPFDSSKVKGEVEFRDVHFGYVPGKEIIHGFSLKVKPGQKVAIVGPTGAGKTTMVNLLMRFYEVNSGDILIDGRSIKDMSREEVHDCFSMVLQDTWLFAGTVRENVVYSKEGVTDEELTDACEAVGLHHYVETLPDKYDTVLDDVSSISVGQRQQITIARAIVQNAPLLILDEATSSIDTRTERKIQEAMDRMMENRTSFVIAHRLSTIRNADVILMMKDGNVIEQGSHEELMRAGGAYCELYNSQFDN